MFKLNVPKDEGSVQENVISVGFGHKVEYMKNKEQIFRTKVYLILKIVKSCSKETWKEENEDLIAQTNDDKLCILYSI